MPPRLTTLQYLLQGAAHHRADGLTSLTVFVALIGALSVRDLYWIDSLGGIMLSLVVLSESLGNATSAFVNLNNSIR